MATETTPAAQPLPKTHDSQSAANLERVTDYAEEKEIVGDFGKVSNLYSRCRNYFARLLARLLARLPESRSV